MYSLSPSPAIKRTKRLTALPFSSEGIAAEAFFFIENPPGKS
jgi:hypothetical protein